ncbi:hypothetical protein [Kitasatospora purpeofusca]|uniref:Uncharacterized protein n=1 Tax=Kitasatospora purpeofusca TaxID=67352 RepID=A0ABZ1U615_9ACTN|nr:hypothetical protein [Kitasatospora purpeofusca]
MISDTLTDTDGTTTEDTAAAGRHRGHSAPDDSPEADPHGRHRAASADPA